MKHHTVRITQLVAASQDGHPYADLTAAVARAVQNAPAMVSHRLNDLIAAIIADAADVPAAIGATVHCITQLQRMRQCLDAATGNAVKVRLQISRPTEYLGRTFDPACTYNATITDVDAMGNKLAVPSIWVDGVLWPGLFNVVQ